MREPQCIRFFPVFYLSSWVICSEKEILWEEPLHDALKLEMYKYKQKTTSKENYTYYYGHNYKTDILDGGQ